MKQSKTAKVIKLPRPEFSFEAIPFKGSILHKYRKNEIYVGICEDILRLSAAKLKARHAALDAESDGIAVTVSP
jgi:hypothetical protein